MTTDLIYLICQDMLAVCLAALEEGGCDPVNRSYVEIGSVMAPVTFGGDVVSQLTVIAGPVNPDLITDSSQRREGRWSSAMLWKSAFTVTLIRPHPTMSGDETAPLPTPEQIDIEAQKHYADVWQLARVLGYKWHRKELVPSFTFTNENVQWQGFTVRPPQGGLRGWDLKFTVSVHDQYVPTTVTPEFE